MDTDNSHHAKPSLHDAYSGINAVKEINPDPPEVNEFLLQTIPETTESEISVLNLEPDGDDHHPHQVMPDHPPGHHP